MSHYGQKKSYFLEELTFFEMMHLFDVAVDTQSPEDGEISVDEATAIVEKVNSEFTYDETKGRYV